MYFSTTRYAVLFSASDEPLFGKYRIHDFTAVANNGFDYLCTAVLLASKSAVGFNK